MSVIFIRTIILYTLVLIVMRAMGKRQIGQLQPFELTIAIMIADLASTPLSSPRNFYNKWNNSYNCIINSTIIYIYFKFEKHNSKRIYMRKAKNLNI